MSATLTRDQQWQRDWRQLRLFAVCRNLMFSVPVLVPFWRAAGLSMTELMLLQSYFSVMSVALEVPTGLLADRFGRRASLVLGMAALGAAVFTYAIGSGLGWFLLAETLFALGHAATSGADVALLHDKLRASGREGEYARRFASYQALQLAAGALSSVVGGACCSAQPVWTWWLTLPALLLGLWPAWRLADDHAVERKHTDWQALLGLRHQRVLRQILLVGALSWGLNRAVQWLLQPLFALAGVPTAQFAVWLAGGMLVAALAGHLAAPWVVRLGTRRSAACLLGASILALAMLAGVAAAWLPLGSVLVVLGLLLLQAVTGAAGTLYSLALNQQLPAAWRATGLSLFSLMGMASYAASIPLLGWLADGPGLAASLLALACALLLTLWPCWYLPGRTSA